VPQESSAEYPEEIGRSSEMPESEYKQAVLRPPRWEYLPIQMVRGSKWQLRSAGEWMTCFVMLKNRYPEAQESAFGRSVNSGGLERYVCPLT